MIQDACFRQVATFLRLRVFVIAVMEAGSGGSVVKRDAYDFAAAIAVSLLTVGGMHIQNLDMPVSLVHPVDNCVFTHNCYL